MSFLGAGMEKQYPIMTKCFAVIVILKRGIYKNKYGTFPLL
jgi:hypothetical protein